MDKQKPFKLYVLFGKEAYAAYGELMDHVRTYGITNADPERDALIAQFDEDLGGVELREFATAAEMQAYIDGLADMEGWQEYNILDDAEVEKLKQVVGE